MNPLPNEITEYILTLVSSKTRAEICSVSKEFNLLAVKISSRKWPVYTEIIVSDYSKYNGWFTKFACKEVYSASKQIISDYHLLVRMKNHQLLNLELAYRTGDDDIMNLVKNEFHKKYRYQTNMFWYEQMAGVSRIGRIDLVKQLMNVRKGNITSATSLENICRSGDLAATQWHLHEYPQIAVGSGCVRAACRSGNLDLIKYVIDLSPWFEADNVIETVCRGGHLHVLKYFVENYKFRDNGLDVGLPAACQKNKMEIVQYLVTNGATRFKYESLHNACIHGRLEVVKYLTLMIAYPKYLNDYTLASKADHQDIMEHLRSVGLVNIRTNTNAFYAACRNGNIDIIKYTLSYEIYEGNHEKGIRLACKNKHYHVAEYLYGLYSQHIENGKFVHKLINRLKRK